VSRPTQDAALDASLRAIADKRVFFGHQSVGQELMAGVQDLVRERGVGPSVLEWRATSDVPQGISHAMNGRNKEPLSKIQAFEAALSGPLRGQTDVAFFKFCYVDITDSTDVDALFREYEAAMARVAAANPQTRFLHVTSPVTELEGGLKGTLKRILGRRLEGFEENYHRERFSALVRARYGPEGTVFDLAEVEATYPDGSKNTFVRSGQAIPALIPAYSYDGKHLNEVGRRRAAAGLVEALARMVDSGPPSSP
jgi:lysophospholipase L1-like esterase